MLHKIICDFEHVHCNLCFIPKGGAILQAYPIWIENKIDIIDTCLISAICTNTRTSCIYATQHYNYFPIKHLPF